MRHSVAFLVACLLALAGSGRARAWQQDDADSRRILEFPNLGPIPGSPGPALGPGPGSFDASGISSGNQIIGGRRRQSILPRGKPATPAATTAHGMRLPEPLPTPQAARRGGMHAGTSALDRSLALDPGPEGGLTYDAAIERMMADNLDIRALRHELSQADADILTAGLRTNPLVYVDSQMVPYGSFSDQRPGGPTQYDLNVTLPLDVSRKRKNRTIVARMAKSALEAQFQDVVRRQIDNVAKAYVGLQATRIELLAAEASVRQQEAILAGIDDDAREPGLSAEDRRALAASRRRMTLVIEQSRGTVLEATEAFEDAQETLAILLGVPPEETATLVPRGSLRVDAPPPPPLDELTRLAAGCRPDLQAMRIGVTRARAEVDLQRANRVDDVFLFYDPITYQDMRPYGKQDATSWAVGLTFSMPIFNRNQGNIARAESNVGQTRVEAASLERRVAAEVRLAEREYRYARRQLERIEETVFTEAEARLEQAQKEFDAGDINFSEYEDAIEDAGAVAHQRREALARYRRAMLDLNTAVGMRILP